jgi:hypothetical protein
VNFSGLRGVFTDSMGHWLNFPTPTHMNIIDNHSNGYGCLKSADVQSSVDRWKSDSSMLLKFGFDFKIDKNYDF